MAGRQEFSDYVLGALLAALAAAVLASGYAAGFREFASAEFFPALIAACMGVAGVLLAASGWFLRDLPPFRWTWLALLAAAVFAFALNISLAVHFSRVFLLLGPPEYAAAIFLLLVLAVAFARRSHLRALGMALIGLLISTAGIDSITGRPRFTGGLDVLLDGFDILVVAPGLLVIGEAMLCLYSPQLWFSTIARWLVPTLAIRLRWPLLLRVLSIVAIAASLWLAWELNHRISDMALALLFGAFGVACLLLGWNRLVLCFALYYGQELEQSLRQSLVLSRDDLRIFTDRPFSGLLIWIALAVFAAAFALWLRRYLKLRRATPAPPA